ncbi:MAG: type II toxin-antitoxin system VapC family toxin [Gemmatimonadota bacterium]
MRFWDSSAIVPLLVRQSTSEKVDRWFAADGSVVAWTLTPVEVTSALWRLVRTNTIAEEDVYGVDARAAEFMAASHVIVDVEAVKSVAQRLLRVHQLRAADALQLGAALFWSDPRKSGATLHTLDERLAIAARREGFEVP